MFIIIIIIILTPVLNFRESEKNYAMQKVQLIWAPLVFLLLLLLLLF